MPTAGVREPPTEAAGATSASSLQEPLARESNATTKRARRRTKAWKSLVALSQRFQERYISVLSTTPFEGRTQPNSQTPRSAECALGQRLAGGALCRYFSRPRLLKTCDVYAAKHALCLFFSLTGAAPAGV